VASSQLATAPEFLLTQYFYINVSGNGVALSEYIGNDEQGSFLPGLRLEGAI
jgi:hypothetical protein